MASSAKPMPRHRLIAATLRRKIGDGRYAVGGRLPTEEELCGQFAASRQTVREALRSLTDEGLIVRRPRAGSVVVARERAMVFAQAVSSIEGLLNYPVGTIRKTIKTEFVEADHRLAGLLKCAPGTPWFRIAALRYVQASNLPLCWTDIYILPKFAGVIRHRSHEAVTVADQIAELYGVTAARAEIEISATEISKTMAKRLDVAPASPGLTVIRRYAAADGTAFETTISVHPGQRHTYSFELRREQDQRRGTSL
jgi:DNA-binding GntR family transcriptional regulator